MTKGFLWHIFDLFVDWDPLIYMSWLCSNFFVCVNFFLVWSETLIDICLCYDWQLKFVNIWCDENMKMLSYNCVKSKQIFRIKQLVISTFWNSNFRYDRAFPYLGTICFSLLANKQVALIGGQTGSAYYPLLADKQVDLIGRQAGWPYWETNRQILGNKQVEMTTVIKNVMTIHEFEGRLKAWDGQCKCYILWCIIM